MSDELNGTSTVMDDNGNNTSTTTTSAPSSVLKLPVVDYSASGFFTVDDLGDLAPLIEAGRVTEVDIQNFLLEEDDNFSNDNNHNNAEDATAVCPTGFICDGRGRTANCTKIRMVPVIMGFGDILAGTYCPEESYQLQNCQVGRYCPDPFTQIPCPEGYFCPHKTAVPEISCHRCEVGDVQIQRDYYGFTVIYLLFMAALVYAATRLIRAYRRETYDKLLQLSSKQMDALRLTKLRQADQDGLEKVRPMLQRIVERMDGGGQGGASVDSGGSRASGIGFGSDGKITYNARQLFAVLDKDNDGYLGYDDLQNILQLRPEQLHYFVRRLHELEGGDHQHRAVSKSCFVRHFLSVLQETCNASPTQEDAAALFDQMDRARRGVIFADELYSSPISYFLSDPEINQLIKVFRRLQTVEQSEREGSHVEGSFFTSAMAQVDPFSTSVRRRQHRSQPMLTKDFFSKFYPTALNDVMNAPEDVPSSLRVADDMEQPTGNRTLGTVDITFEDLSLTVQAGEKPVNVVNHVSGRIQAGTLTALMGGSGAGKTSLLNALCGRAFYGTTSGKIYINGQEARIDDHKAVTGFVPQDDIVYAELTVKECLMFSGRFSSPKGTSLQELEDLADATLANLGLSRVANSIVGDVNRRGVSGGEKKRVNIGVTLMARPSFLCLDEPTSGLDSSSALLVMQSLKALATQGVTVLSVIHQPRKVIFDLFDSLVLLGWGGNMVYHGPVPAAEVYFSSIPKPYTLPVGESLADWLIDISTGLLKPDDEDHSDRMGKRKLTRGRHTAPSGTSAETANEQAKLRREDLFEFWRHHFAALQGGERQMYQPPKPTDFPVPLQGPPFWDQLKIQLERNLLVTWRNRNSKIVDVCLIVVAVTLSAGFEGPLQLTWDHVPLVSFWELTSGSPGDLYRNFPQFFLHAIWMKAELVQFTLKLGVITSVLLSLTATKAITSKRLEFFRESASGYDINAYFAAINITGFFEYSLQMIIAGAAAFWLRGSVALWYSYVYNFLMIMWLTVSWCLVLPLVVPGNNVVIAAGFFTAFFSLLFSGGLPPVEYIQLYHEENGFLQIFSGFFSVTRFFIEGMIVQEQRCLPQQSGYTISELSVSFPMELSSFSLTSLAGNDESVVQKSCNGWYWSFWPALFIGITVRYAAAGLIHASERGKQARKSLLTEIKAKPFNENPITQNVIKFMAGFLVLFIITSVLIVLERGSIGIDQQEGLLDEKDEMIISEILDKFVGNQAH